MAKNQGVIYKAAVLEPQEVTEADLRAINKFALSPLAAEDVYTFSAVLCDNELDRQHERFSLRALNDLKKLFVGKPVIKDHNASADNQVARIYATEVVPSERVLSTGEAYTQLKARCYMVRTAGNADLITEISAGIKREGSVGFRASSAICSICGTDNAKSYCRHFPGRTYDKEGGKTVCTFRLDGASDAYEFSFVVVPAQRGAGASKAYMGEEITPDDDAPEPTDDTAGVLTLRARTARARERMRLHKEAVKLTNQF